MRISDLKDSPILSQKRRSLLEGNLIAANKPAESDDQTQIRLVAERQKIFPANKEARSARKLLFKE